MLLYLPGLKVLRSTDGGRWDVLMALPCLSLKPSVSVGTIQSGPSLFVLHAVSEGSR